MFGDCVFVLEFLTCYQPLFKFELPSNITIGTSTIELILLQMK